MNLPITEYHSQWQINRMNYILSLYDESYFKDKRVLELGSFNGFFGMCFKNLGSDVLSIEGRQSNIDIINKTFPDLKVECHDLDTNEWSFGHQDVIINFGLFYHLQKFHKEHLVNCIKNCKIMFFETVIFDSSESEIYYRDEIGEDQSLNNSGGVPSTKYIEDILNSCNVKYKKICDSSLNGDGHSYSWGESDSRILQATNRRMWIVENNI